MPKTILPCELGNLHWPEIESLAFQTFISDYCISSSNRTVSRGYLDGLESLIEKAGPASTVSQSYKIVSLANLGKKAASPILLQKAETLYFDLLPSFRWTISNEGKFTTIQSLITAVLLGLYEVSIACAQVINTLFTLIDHYNYQYRTRFACGSCARGISHSHEQILAV
jgi:hypothetical protein